MKLYKERAKAEALAIVDAGTSVRAASAATGVPESTLRSWRADEIAHMDPETRASAKKHFAEKVEHVRSLYLERAMEPEAVAKTSGFYAVLAVKNLNEVHQLLTGGATQRIDLATFLTSPAGGGDPTDPVGGGR